MEIKILPKSVQDLLRTGTTIKSASHCTTQLVLNSLDAKSTSIAIRVNLITYHIQVIDNGKGISKHNFELIGQRYATNKYLSTKELKANPCIFGQRGEALASIIKISKTVKITSKTADSTETYMKTFENGKSLGVSDTSERASRGTTVLIEDFMYNLPVRKTHMKINNCIEEIKNEIEAISLIHPNISFSLRHDPSGEIIFQTYKSKFVYQTTTHLYGKEFTKQLRKIHFTNDKLKITGMISVVGHGHKRIQLVYVNKRHLKKSKIHSLINSLIRRSKILKNNSSPTLKHKYGVYIINLRCSRSEYDVVDFNNILIEFRNWDDILVCIEQAVKQFLETENLMEKPKETKANDFQVGTPAWQMPIQVRTSQYDGVIRGVSVKRKPAEEISESRLSAITIEDSDNASAGKEKKDNGTLSQKKKPKMTTKEVKEKLPIAENLESKKDKNDNEKEIVKGIFAKTQTQKKMKYYNSLKVETHTNTKENYSCNDRDLRSLKSAQDIILDMFLKSTALFKTDEELIEEFAKNNKENIDKPADVTANPDKQSNNEHSSNSAKLQNHIPNLEDHCNFEQISGKQIIHPVIDNVKPLSKKDVSNLDDQINVITHSNQNNQINSKQEAKNLTSNLIKQDNFTQISKNQIINFNNPTKPVQVSKAIQVSASKIPELNWNPDARKIDPFQRKPPSKSPIALKPNLHQNLNLNLNQQMARCEKPQEQFNGKQNSNLKQIFEKSRLNNELLKKPRLINGKDNNFKLNYKVKKVLAYKDIFKNNKRNDQTRHFTRKPLKEKTYVQTNYGNYKRIKHDAEKYKIPIRTRFNFRLASSSSSTFAHRDLTTLKYNKYNYTVRRTKKFVHSSNFIKPAINDKEKRFKKQQTKFNLNPRETLHANSMMKTWFDLKKKPNQLRQNFRDTKCYFVKTFSPKKNQTFKRNNLPYIKRGYTEVNNFRRNILKPNDDLQMESFKPVKEKVFVPYFNVQKKIRSFENDNKQNRVNKILAPNHVDFQNCFKKPKSPQPCNKNVNEPNNLYNNITISESLDITFATILPENEDAVSVCDNQNVPEIIEILAPRNCESISEINDKNLDSSFQYPYTKHIDYSSYKNLMKSPMPLSNKEMEDNYHFQEMNFQHIPQASDDAYIPFRTNPRLNEKTKHVRSNIPSHNYANMNKYSAENKQCIPTYFQCQDNEILNRFLSENTHNNTLDIQPQKLEHFNKSTEKAKQLKSYLQPECYEKPRNMQERKRTFLNERLAYPSSNPQAPEKCLNTLAENTESFNITFSPKRCMLPDVSMDKNNSNSHELSKIQKRQSNFKDSVTETPVSKMGQYISSHNISSSKNVDIINKLPSGNNLPSRIKNVSLAPNNNTEEIITNNLNMDIPTRKLSKNLSHRSKDKAKQDLNNISCSNGMSKHVSLDVIAIPSEKFNGTQLNLNNKNSEHIHIVSSTKEATNNNHNSDIDSYSVVDLISCGSMKVNEDPDKLKHSNNNPNGGQDLNGIDVVSNNPRSPERQLHTITSDMKLNRRSETPKTITSTHSKRNLELNVLKLDTKNVEISAVNLQNNTEKVKSKSAVEQILFDFESLYNSDSEKNVKNQCSTSDKNNIEVTKIQFDVAKNSSVVESVLLDLQNIISSADSENNLNIHTLHPEKNNSQISTEYLKFSYEPVDIAKNNMDAEDNPDDFDITFDFDPDLNLSNPKHIAFEDNEICKSSMNTENCRNNGDSKKEEKMSNKTEKVLNCEDKSNIENVTSASLTNIVPDSNENNVEIGKSSTITNNKNDISSHEHQSLKSAKNSISDDTSLLPMTDNLKTSENRRNFPRPSFLPKGMSPILYSVSTAPIKKLSPTSKKKLHQIMAKSKYDDLQTVKWMNYFQTKDGKTFFSDLYSDKKNYEKVIPNLNAKMLPKKVMDGLNNFTFSKECFDRLTVISQWDNKFIVTKVMIGGNQNKLVLFDQHAVHERIRLENLLKEYKVNENPNLKSVKCNAKVKLKLDEIDIRMLKSYKINFESWGLFYNIKDKRTAIFTKIPICWESKDECVNTDSTSIKSLIKDLIAEVSNWLRNTGKINIVIPHVILNSIKMEACRGAVKFGDILTKEKCEEFLSKLSFCDLPFQCAHGRPTLVPIYNLNELNTSNKTRKVHWNKLKIGINKHT